MASLACVPAILGASGDAATAPRRDDPGSPRDVALARAVDKICRRGKCQRSDTLTKVEVWRDKRSRARLLVYTSTGCSETIVTYHDVAGRFLVAELGGPREPDEWNAPEDRKIERLKTGLKAAESYLCHEIASPTEK